MNQETQCRGQSSSNRRQSRQLQYSLAMPSCAAFGCTNRSERERKKGITFHRFPRDLTLRQEWVNRIGRGDYEPTINSVVCSVHFEEAQVDRTSVSSVRLKEGAIPTIFFASSSSGQAKPKTLAIKKSPDSITSETDTEKQREKTQREISTLLSSFQPLNGEQNKNRNKESNPKTDLRLQNNDNNQLNISLSDPNNFQGKDFPDINDINSQSEEDDDDDNHDYAENDFTSSPSKLLDKILNSDVMFDSLPSTVRMEERIKKKESWNNSYNSMTAPEELPRDYKCEICGERFKYDDSLSLHMVIHSGQRECPLCGKVFAYVSRLKRHMYSHTGEGKHSCPTCGKSFLHNSNLQNHLMTHSNEKPFPCKECGKCYARKDHLDTHMKIHIGDKAFVCGVCGKDFILNSKLERHMKTHINNRPYACELCDKTFTFAHNLTLHLRTHSKNKPYKCQGCDKSFTTSTQLRYHSAIHSKSSQFKCSVCGRSFGLQSLLDVHFRTHTGERPFPCSLCGKGFVCVGALNRHLKIHNSKNMETHSAGETALL